MANKVIITDGEGTVGQVLTSAGAGVIPVFEDATGGSPSGTINEIAYFDTSSSIASLAVATYPSLTELSYSKGVTSAIQTQMNLKAPLISPSFTTPALGTPSAGVLTNCTFPTLNQNTTGTAAGLSSTLAIASGGTGSTTLADAEIPTYASTNTFTNKTIDGDTNTLQDIAVSSTKLAAGNNITLTTDTLAVALTTGTNVTGDHGTATTDQLINVCYGTSATPPTASTTTEGALYIQYTA